TADIGVAMGAAGTGVAIETADIALMKDDLLKLPQAISLARRTVTTMRQNIAIALATVAALLAGVLFGGVTMSIGMLVHEASVLVVIANAMRLLRRVPGAPGGTRHRNNAGTPADDPRATLPAWPGSVGVRLSGHPPLARWPAASQLGGQLHQRVHIGHHQAPPGADVHHAGVVQPAQLAAERLRGGVQQRGNVLLRHR